MLDEIAQFDTVWRPDRRRRIRCCVRRHFSREHLNRMTMFEQTNGARQTRNATTQNHYLSHVQTVQLSVIDLDVVAFDWA